MANTEELLPCCGEAPETIGVRCSAGGELERWPRVALKCRVCGRKVEQYASDLNAKWNAALNTRPAPAEDEVIEQVAHALATFADTHLRSPGSAVEWNERTAANQEYFRKAARAAISALTPAREDERVRIVAWLRAEAAEMRNDEAYREADVATNAANCIERGEHLPNPPEGEG